MKNDYPLKGETKSVTVTLEVEVAETIKLMADNTKISESEMINTAIKRFIATHSDYLPKKK
jgi:hypothetical protein